MMMTGAIMAGTLEAGFVLRLRDRLGVRSACFNADTMGRYFLLNERLPLKMAAHATTSAKRRIRIAERELRGHKKTFNRLAADNASAEIDNTVVFSGSAEGARMRVPSFANRVRRCIMPIVRSAALALAAAFLPMGFAAPAQAQSALDAAQELAQMLDGANPTQIDSDNLVSALEGAAAAGQPIALWQLGIMYETGSGVDKDPAKAFQYFSQIANDNADAPPSSLDADIVAQSFVKIGDYFLNGVPDAGIVEDNARGRTLIMHAASYFGDADAQYRVGMLYLDPSELGPNPLQSARWFSLAARKGHPGAQARLGDMLVRGEGMEAQPVEGLMWLNIAYRGALGTGDESWIGELAQGAMSLASESEAEAALRAADSLGAQFAEY